MCDGLAYSRQSKLDENPHQHEKKEEKKVALFCLTFTAPSHVTETQADSMIQTLNVVNSVVACYLTPASCVCLCVRERTSHVFCTWNMRVSVCERERTSDVFCTVNMRVL